LHAKKTLKLTLKLAVVTILNLLSVILLFVVEVASIINLGCVVRLSVRHLCLFCACFEKLLKLSIR
jgi:hypothetical protein